MKVSEYKQLFLSEAQEILNSLNSVLVDLEKELKLAQEEMRSGSLERAAAILNYLQKKLQKSPESLDL